MNVKTDGLVVATFSPMKEDGALNLGIVPAYAETLAGDGVAGLFVNGSTGEGVSMTNRERMASAEAWKAASGDMKFIVHVGHHALGDACALARHAESIGADALAMVAPSYFKPGVDQMVACCARVAAAAPSTPFYYYHIPSLSGVRYTACDFLRAAGPAIPTLAGIKYTFEDLMDYQQALDFEGGRYDVLYGRDEMLLPALAVGARGFIGSTYNYDATLYLAVIDAYRRRDFAGARRLMARAQASVNILAGSGCGIACAKAITSLMKGIDLGPCRLPLPSFGPGKLAWVAERLRAMGSIE